jgi:3-deoxy-D-manno-octulosonic-acid transferase
MLFILYRYLTMLIYPFYRYGILPKRLRAGKEDPQRFQEKLGFCTLKRPAGKLVWFHATSVGESLSLLKLIEALMHQYPNWTYLITSNTWTSAQIIQARYPKGVIHQYAPVDFVPCLRRFWQHWKPDRLILVESELWPNWIEKAYLEKTPLVLVNMRLSSTSLKRWRGIKKTFITLLNRFELILTQTQHLATELKALGMTQISFLGNLKYVADIPTIEAKTLEKLKGSLAQRSLVWVAASTHSGEEEQILSAQVLIKKKIPDSLLILVPRHPARSSEVTTLVERYGFSLVSFSHWQTSQNTLTTDVLVGDQMGILTLFYAIAPQAFVGGSLMPQIGGHNPLEPVRQGCIPLYGPFMGNFLEVHADLSQAEVSLQVPSAAVLAQKIVWLHENPAEQKTYQERGVQFMEKQKDILGHIQTVLSPYFEEGIHARS